MSSFIQLLRDDDGATAVEYAVMLALIMLACIGSFMLMSNETASSFSTSADRIQGAMAS